MFSKSERIVPTVSTRSVDAGLASVLASWLRRANPFRAAADARSPIRAAIAQGPTTELVDHAEAFQSLRVADVMTPRADLTGVEISSPLEAVIRAFAESEHSRLPVYRGNLDDPVGVVHLKDVFKLMAKEKQSPASVGHILRRLKREALYVPPSMRAADLLVRMQASRIHMAMVIDEFGGVDGLVTLEDVIEAVVGEIDDEHDDEVTPQILARAGDVFEVDGRVALDELESALGMPLSAAEIEDDIDTVAGLVTALAGRVPQRGEVIAHPAGLEFEIIDADPRRVKRLRVRPISLGPSASAQPSEA